MDISVGLARFWGFYMLIFFVVLSFNPKRIRKIFGYLKDPGFLHITAFIAIIMGLVQLILHNLWVADWRILITLLGWTSLLTGIFMFVFPDKAGRNLPKFPVQIAQWIYILLLVLGGVLLRHGYAELF